MVVNGLGGGEGPKYVHLQTDKISEELNYDVEVRRLNVFITLLRRRFGTDKQVLFV